MNADEERELLLGALRAILAIDSTIHDHPTWGLDLAKSIASKVLEKVLLDFPIR